jgi:hypothetical protein
MERKEGAINAMFNYYATLVYPGQPQLGEVNVKRLRNLQDFYLRRGSTQRKSPVEDAALWIPAGAPLTGYYWGLLCTVVRGGNPTLNKFA